MTDRHAALTARDWRSRWDAIRPHLPPPGIALDLGASDGAFSRALADLGWTVHAFDMRVQPSVAHPRVIWHRERLDARGIAGLARRLRPNRGRFDLVLALSLLHWMDDYAAAYWAIRWIGERAIIEVPHPAETPAKAAMFTALDALARHDGEVIGASPGSHTTLLRPIIATGHGAPQGRVGRVHTGSGNSAAIIGAFRDTKALGYRPYPGTLDHQLLEPFALADRDAVKVGGWRFWPINYQGIPAHIAGHPGWKAAGTACDVIAAVPLRAAFALEDGDLTRLDFGGHRRVTIVNDPADPVEALFAPRRLA